VADPIEAGFEAAVAPLFADRRVGRGRKQLCCEVDGRVFAMVSLGQMVVKLPRARVDALIAAGSGRPYQLGARVMKEWVALTPEARDAWPGLAEEACRFVGGTPSAG